MRGCFLSMSYDAAPKVVRTVPYELVKSRQASARQILLLMLQALLGVAHCSNTSQSEP